MVVVLLTAHGHRGVGALVMFLVVEDRDGPGGRSALWPSVEDDLVTRRMSLRG